MKYAIAIHSLPDCENKLFLVSGENPLQGLQKALLKYYPEHQITDEYRKWVAELAGGQCLTDEDWSLAVNEVAKSDMIVSIK